MSSGIELQSFPIRAFASKPSLPHDASSTLCTFFTAFKRNPLIENASKHTRTYNKLLKLYLELVHSWSKNLRPNAWPSWAIFWSCVELTFNIPRGISYNKYTPEGEKFRCQSRRRMLSRRQKCRRRFSLSFWKQSPILLLWISIDGRGSLNRKVVDFTECDTNPSYLYFRQCPSNSIKGSNITITY